MKSQRLLPMTSLSVLTWPIQISSTPAHSLFTHVPRPATQQWLTYLATLLSPSGVVIATTHGRWCEHIYDRVQYISVEKWQQIVAAFQSTGYGYASYARAER